MFLGLLVLIASATGCGRSSLDEEYASTTTGTSTCGPSTCPDGCCDSTGACRTGGDVRACGSAGGKCSDCIGTGYSLCTTSRVCGRDDASCSATTCSGCCTVDDGRLRCLAGNEPAACGQSGAQCADCQTEGRSCDPSSRACGTSRCTPENCAGCCVDDKCLPGTTPAACGDGGDTCATCATGQSCRTQTGVGGACSGVSACGPTNCGGCCTATGACVTGSDSTACGKNGQLCAACGGRQTCVADGQGNERTCQTPATCGPDNCAGCCVGNQCVTTTTAAACGASGAACKACGKNQICDPAGTCIDSTSQCGLASCAGCCVGDFCETGTQNAACGTGGDTCANCSAQSRVCQSGVCQAPACSAANCASGCCDGNTCVTGTLNAACGVGGAACTDCADTGSFCDSLVTPRRCSDQQASCPATYGMCAVGITTPVMATTQRRCTDRQLDTVVAACATDPDSVTCTAAVNALGNACATCLAPFKVPFAQNSGLWTCAAPSVGANCRRVTGCATSCATTSCTQCDDATEGSCYGIVNGIGGQCSVYATAANCTALELQAGQLCSQFSYGSFGAWFRAVGDHFCGNGP